MTEVNMKLCRMVGFFLNVIQFCVNVANQLDKIKFQAWLTFKYSIWALHFVFIALLRKHLEMAVVSRN